MMASFHWGGGTSPPPPNTNDYIEQSPAQGGIAVEGAVQHAGSFKMPTLYQ